MASEIDEIRARRCGTHPIGAPGSIARQAEGDVSALLTAYDAERALREALEEQLRAAERERAEAVDRADESDRQRTQACQRWAAAADELQAARESWDGSNRTLTLRLAEVTSERDGALARAEKAERERDDLRAQLTQAKAEGAREAYERAAESIDALPGYWYGMAVMVRARDIEEALARLAGEEPKS